MKLMLGGRSLDVCPCHADDNTDEDVDDGDVIGRRDDNGRVRSAADHVTMKLAIVADDYELTTTSITFYDCSVHSSYVS